MNRSPRKTRRAPHLAPWLLLLSLPVTAAAAEVIGPRPGYEAAAAELERAILGELREKGIPALSIALADEDGVIWARGFGLADPGKKIPATAATVYRAGSVSKLFTAIAVMQLVERGDLDLDAPASRYLPELPQAEPPARPITLRQLLSHRSGLVREPPVGHYFDDGGPSLEATVRSLGRTALVYEPETRIKYSNAAVAAAGLAVERAHGEPFEAGVRRTILAPLGLEGTSFTLDPPIAERLARASMWTYHGSVFPAPVFALGTSAAGNLYAPVTDLARFLTALFRGGEGPGGRILEAAALERMMELQFARPEDTGGFGIGFAVSRLDGEVRIGHGGAVYGFATELAALPQRKAGAAVAASLDGANAVTRRLADHALRCILAARAGKPPPRLEAGRAVEPELARRLAGRYSDGRETIELEARGDRLLIDRRGFLAAVRALGDGKLIADDRHVHGPEIEIAGEALRIGGRDFRRVERKKPEPPPERWRGLIGEYGWDHNVLYIHERDGGLRALIEWFYDYPLSEVSEDVFAFPDHGLYHGEKLIFRRGAGGRASAVEAASVLFERRAGGEEGKTFRIEPSRPIEELRRLALASAPPAESGEFLAPDLVDLAGLDPAIRFDIRYAGANNFLGAAVYPEARAFLQRPAAEALLRALGRLKESGYGLLIHDAYRPWHITKVFWEATPESMRHFVADPSEGSRHNRGAAVDLTLYDLRSGEPARMPGGYDEFTERSYPHYPGGSALERWQRDLLRGAMEAEGFTVYEFEWWHFDYSGWRRWPILDLPFEKIPAAPAPTESAGFRPLFNGKDLAGWVDAGKPGSFTVAEGGILAAEKKPGTDSAYLLRTEKEHGDFTLRLEFRLTRGANSGVFIRVPHFRGRASSDGMEIQAIDDAGRKNPGKGSSGAIYNAVAPKSIATRPSGEWNRLEIDCSGDRVRVTLNGELVNDADMSRVEALKERPRKGYICLSAHTGLVEFRNIEIREPKVPSTP